MEIKVEPLGVDEQNKLGERNQSRLGPPIKYPFDDLVPGTKFTVTNVEPSESGRPSDTKPIRALATWRNRSRKSETPRFPVNYAWENASTITFFVRHDAVMAVP